MPNLIILQIYFRLDGLIWQLRPHMRILTYKTVTGDAPSYLHDEHDCIRLNISLQNEIKYEKLS